MHVHFYLRFIYYFTLLILDILSFTPPGWDLFGNRIPSSNMKNKSLNILIAIALSSSVEERNPNSEGLWEREDCHNAFHPDRYTHSNWSLSHLLLWEVACLGSSGSHQPREIARKTFNWAKSASRTQASEGGLQLGGTPPNILLCEMEQICDQESHRKTNRQ